MLHRDRRGDTRDVPGGISSTRRTACVCVERAELCVGAKAERAESHDGAASPPRGPVLRTGQRVPHTTTNYTLVLFISSKGRESNLNLTLMLGGRYV
jgi:hypothetical protein